MKAFIAIGVFVVATTLVAQTNTMYVTEKISTNIDMFVDKTNQTDDVITLAESRPANEDLGGNWGQVMAGFQMSIRLGKDSFTNGEPVNADIILRNVSFKTVRFLFFYPKNHLLKLVLEKQNEMNTTGIQEKQSRGLAGKIWRPMIQVGKQYKYIIGLTNFFDLTPGKYKIQAQQLVIDSANKVATNVISGYATFNIVSNAP